MEDASSLAWEWIAFAIGALGWVVAALTFALSFPRRKADRLISIHESMMETEKQKGRKLLYARSESDGRPVAGLWDEDAVDDLRSVNHVLATFDILGFYTKRRWVEPRDIYELWGRSLVRMRKPVTEYMAQRAGREPGGDDPELWPYFRDLLAGAAVRDEHDALGGEGRRFRRRYFQLLHMGEIRKARREIAEGVGSRAAEVRAALAPDDRVVPEDR